MAACSIVGRWLTPAWIGLFALPQSSSVGGLKLNGPLVAAGDVLSFETAGNFAVYRADQDVDFRFELFSVPIDASAPVVRLNGPLVGGGVVGTFRIDPGASRVVYGADQDTNDVVELYSVPIDGSSPAVKLNPPLVLDGDVQAASIQISPDGTRVLYRADQDANEVFELYVVPIDGSSGPVKVNGLLCPGGDVGTQVRWDPTGTRVVYQADQVSDEVFEILSVPADGSANEVRLNAILVAGGDTGFYDISPDGTRVVYSGDQDTNDVVELYSVPIDASTPPVQLNPPLVAGGDVSGSSTEISSDGARVVYVADQDTDQLLELYSVPIDGSSPAVKLNAAHPPGLFGGFRITPDGSRVVYQAGKLYSVPIDRSAEPVEITGDPAGSIFPWLLSPDSARAVYVLRLSNRNELRSVAIDGSSGSTLLSTGGVNGLECADASTVVFGTWNAQDQLELFSVPIDGSAGRLMLSRPLVPGGTVRSFATGSGRVFYLADQDVAGKDELYVSFFTRRFVRAPGLR